MDFNSLKDQVSNLSLYDIKAGVRKVQNGTWFDQEYKSVYEACQYLSHQLLSFHLTDSVIRLAMMNYTEMEAKVGAFSAIWYTAQAL